MSEPRDYPDISDILARKRAGKRQAAARSYAEKVAMVEALRERLAPFKRAREARLAAVPPSTDCPLFSPHPSAN